MQQLCLAALRVATGQQWLEHLPRSLDSLALLDSASAWSNLQAGLAWLGQGHEHGLCPGPTAFAPQQWFGADLAIAL